MKERLDNFDVSIGDDDGLTEERIARFETIQKQTTNIQLHAERRCRNTMKPDLNCSDKVTF